MDIELAKKLSNAYGISGNEDNIQAIMEKELTCLTSNIKRDELGSLVFEKIGNSTGPKIMLAAHMDEVGFIVKSIDEKGFIRFAPVGGWWSHVLLGQRIKVITSDNKEFIGVVGSKPPHILTENERKNLLKIEDMYIDLGAQSQEEVFKAGIKVGDMIVPDSAAVDMLNDDFILGKAWDDRIGCLLLIELMRKLKTEDHPNIVYAVATVQEEIGLKGAKTSATLLNPDIAFAIDTGVPGDTPGIDPIQATANLGDGPQITYMDAGMIIDKNLKLFIEKIAGKNNLIFQPEILLGGSTDAASIQLVHSGVPTTAISLATRYIHSHNSIISKKDFEIALELLYQLVMNINEDTIKDILDK